VSDIFTWQLGALPTLAALAFGYLFGSIPFGLILTRMAGLGDVRQIGSGNIGATNVLRTGNKKLAAATLLLDALKGTAATAIASLLRALPPSSATSSPSGSASRAARGLRPMSGCCSASCRSCSRSSRRSGSALPI
jgi:hypothetical protein